jgi:hypothetical protein
MATRFGVQFDPERAFAPFLEREQRLGALNTRMAGQKWQMLSEIPTMRRERQAEQQTSALRELNLANAQQLFDNQQEERTRKTQLMELKFESMNDEGDVDWAGVVTGARQFGDYTLIEQALAGQRQEVVQDRQEYVDNRTYQQQMSQEAAEIALNLIDGGAEGYAAVVGKWAPRMDQLGFSIDPDEYDPVKLENIAKGALDLSTRLEMVLQGATEIEWADIDHQVDFIKNAFFDLRPELERLAQSVESPQEGNRLAQEKLTNFLQTFGPQLEPGVKAMIDALNLGHYDGGWGSRQDQFQKDPGTASSIASTGGATDRDKVRRMYADWNPGSPPLTDAQIADLSPDEYLGLLAEWEKVKERVGHRAPLSDSDVQKRIIDVTEVVDRQISDLNFKMAETVSSYSGGPPEPKFRLRDYQRPALDENGQPTGEFEPVSWEDATEYRTTEGSLQAEGYLAMSGVVPILTQKAIDEGWRENPASPYMLELKRIDEGRREMLFLPTVEEDQAIMRAVFRRFQDWNMNPENKDEFPLTRDAFFKYVTSTEGQQWLRDNPETSVMVQDVNLEHYALLADPSDVLSNMRWTGFVTMDDLGYTTERNPLTGEWLDPEGIANLTSHGLFNPEGGALRTEYLGSSIPTGEFLGPLADRGFYTPLDALSPEVMEAVWRGSRQRGGLPR